ncbi:alpha/beta hydrolase [Microcoleus sp. FACHB-672]|uniref:alpha/beta hydrolase n=1 Tax=Microcoleus sp. FACHB-672 TaxID=2692825 RepID=UPI001685D250|nr:alpha/beta hydrolase [Microcoleus sp. FACHB-672]MBD2040470.1 alpha/beta hydrolase [Microcoleus sp. FACHB-672]
MSKLNRPNSKVSETQRRFKQPVVKFPAWAITPILLGSIVLAGICTAVMPASAAERVMLRLGPFQQSVEIADLERFAETGEVSTNLQPIAYLLTPDVRRVLSDRLELSPDQASDLVDELLKSPGGDRIVQAVRLILPGIGIEQVEAALMLAARQANNVSISSLFRALPGETITVDLSALVSALSKLNLPYLGTKALDSYLQQESSVEHEPVLPNFNPAAAGDKPVRQQTLTFSDRQRGRSLPVEVYWSTQSADSQQPLVVISHGLGSDRQALAYLASHLASHGMTVAAVEHPGSNVAWQAGAPITLDPSQLLAPSEFIDRPLDVSFVLDEFAKLNRQSGLLQGKLNTDQVSMIGHSLGGYTALALAGGELQLDELRDFCKNKLPVGYSAADWLQCSAANLIGNRRQLQDERVVQVIALNPIVGRLFGQTGLSKVTTPTLILAATEDVLAPALNHQLQPFTQLAGDKYLITAIGGTHLSVTESANLTRAGGQNSIVKERRGADIEPLRQLLQGVSLAFIKQQTPEAQTYAPFLSPTYARSLSTQALPLRLSTELPANLSRWLQVGTQE